MDAFQRLAQALTQRDPALAIGWAERHFEQPEGELLYQVIARHWSHQDAAAALDWVLGWSDAERRKRAAFASYRIFLAFDTDGALQWLDAQSTQPVIRLLNRVAITHLAAKGRPLEAIARANAEEEPSRRERLLIAAVAEWRAVDGEAAEAWVEEQAFPEELVARIRAARPGARVPRAGQLEELEEDQDPEPPAG